MSIQSEPPPTAVDIFVSGSRWAQPFKDAIAASGSGHPRFGYRVSSVIPPVLPWTGVDQLTVIFGGNLVIDAGDLSVIGRRGGSYPVASVESTYNPDNSGTIATWTLANPVENDVFTIEVNGDAPDGVHELNTNVFLDGDNDGVPGGDFRRLAAVLVGDAANDGRVNALDLGTAKELLNRVADPANTGPGSYYTGADIDANGRINALDLGLVKRNLNQRLPSPPATLAQLASPTCSTLPETSSATHELFGSAHILG